MCYHECSGYFHTPFPQCGIIALRQRTHQNDCCLRFEWPDVEGVPQKQLQRAYKVCRCWLAGCWLHGVRAGHQRLPKHNLSAELLHHRCWDDSRNRKISSRIFGCLQPELIHRQSRKAIERLNNHKPLEVEPKIVRVVLVHLRCQIPQVHHSPQLRLLQQIRAGWNHRYARGGPPPEIQATRENRASHSLLWVAACPVQRIPAFAKKGKPPSPVLPRLPDRPVFRRAPGTQGLPPQPQGHEKKQREVFAGDRTALLSRQHRKHLELLQGAPGEQLRVPGRQSANLAEEGGVLVERVWVRLHLLPFIRDHRGFEVQRRLPWELLRESGCEYWGEVPLLWA